MEKTIDFGIVADLYDTYVQTDFDIAFYKDFCKGYKNILELMCGTGRISLPLIESGYPLTCVDYSEELLSVFRSKLSASKHNKIICQDVCDLNLDEQFDLVIIPFHSFSEIIDFEKRKQAVSAIYHHLQPGDKFLCTLYNPAYRVKSADGNLRPLGKFGMNDSSTLFVTYYNNYSETDKIISGVQFYEIYDSKNNLFEKRCLHIRFSVIDKNEMQSIATESGFSLVNIYGDYNGNPYKEDSMFMNFVFEK